MREKIDLAGLWDGELTFNPRIDVAAPKTFHGKFHIPLAWNLQIDSLHWSMKSEKLSAVIHPIQNQNFYDVERKFSEGEITYRKTLTLAKQAGMMEFLVFEGSNFHTTLFINGKKVGENRNGHLKFEFDITDYTVDGENEFVIVVDNFRNKHLCPQEQFNWKNYGGIYRPLFLEYRPEIHIKHLVVLPLRENGQWYADVRVDLNTKASVELGIEIISGDETEKRMLDCDNKDTVSVKIPFDTPATWSPASPRLSRIESTIHQNGETTDKITNEFGFRTVEIEGRKILLNGKPFRIMGASFHEQHPTFGNSVPGWQWTRDLRLLKHCGLNAVRAAHYPYSQEFYDACDREGVLCLAELQCWQFNSFHFENTETENHCKTYAERMVKELGNHPSIIAWVVQNESQTFEPKAGKFFSSIISSFKRLDETRFTLSAENQSPPEHLAVVKQVKGAPTGNPSETAKLVDALGINDYSGWYGEKAEYLPLLLDHAAEKLPDKPIIVTEFGAEATGGARSGTLARYSEDYHAELLKHHITEILKRDFIAGFFIWLFFDYEPSSISILGLNAKGILNADRTPKLAFDHVKTLIERHLKEPILGDALL